MQALWQAAHTRCWQAQGAVLATAKLAEFIFPVCEGGEQNSVESHVGESGSKRARLPQRTEEAAAGADIAPNAHALRTLHSRQGNALTKNPEAITIWAAGCCLHVPAAAAKRGIAI